MSRIALPFVLLVIALSAVQAQQLQTHGVPASVTSPTSDGRLHGVPSSITSPTPVPGARSFGVPNSRVVFGSPRGHHRRADLVPVPVFYPVYIDSSSAAAEPQPPAESADGEVAASASENDALREAYDRGAQDALTELRARQRLSERAAAAQEKPKSKPQVREEKKAAADDAPATARTEEPPQPVTPGPPTIFIFKDGRKLESQNYAIVGQTLYDFSVKGLHKIRLTELDIDATRKINEDSGTPVSLP
ncbi:MAG: hypothetical protein LAP21_11185 [Acidobacteriia bacterium]|nr:hypothetical protein [Terriglobia bacterium]